MKRFSIKLWLEKIRIVAIRFPFTLFYILGLAYLFLSQINHWITDDYKPMYWSFFVLGIPMSIALSLFAEQFLNKFSRLGFQLGGLVLLALFSYFMPDKYVPVFTYQLMAVGLVMALSILFVSYFRRDNDINFWEFTKVFVFQLIIAFGFALVLFAGLSLAILSLKELFDVDINEKVYANLSVICYVLFAPFYLLANIPDEIDKYKNEYTFHKIMKILGMYILLPILSVYFIILYVYLARIIIQWELPNGWISTLVSVLSLGGFVTMLILFPLYLESKTKVVNVFFRYFSLLLFPLLVLMLIGIIRRYTDYGITINRSYILLLNLWLFGISHYLFYSKARHVKWIFISFSTILFLTSIGPWRVTNLTKIMLTNQLENLFVKENMFENGKVITNTKHNIDSVSNEKMVVIIEYLSRNYGNDVISTYFNDSIGDLSTYQLLKKLNLKSESKINELNYISANLLPGYVISLNQYQDMIGYNFSKSNGINYKNEKYSITLQGTDIILKERGNAEPDKKIELKPWLNTFQPVNGKKRNNHMTIDEMTIESSNCKLVILNISATYGPDKSKYTISDLNVLLYINE